MIEKLRVLGVLAAVCLVLATHSEARRQAQQPPPVFRAGVTFVNVDAYPRRDGTLVEGLRAEDFQILEDGKPQAVETFEFIRVEANPPDAERRDPTSVGDANKQAADPHNRVFVVYLDLYHTTFGGAHETRRPLLDFLSRVIGATDLFGVMTPAVPVRQLTFGRRLETLEGELTKYFDWGERDKPVTPLNAVEQQLETCMSGSAPSLGDALVALHRDDLMMTNLEELMVHLRDLRDERKNLLLISEGWVPRPPQDMLQNLGSGSIPRIGTEPGTGRLGVGGRQGGMRDQSWCDREIMRLASIDFDYRFRELLTLAARANVSFYPIDVGGLRTGVPSMARRGGPLVDTPQERVAARIVTQSQVPSIVTLQTLAENTDGRAIVNSNDLNAGLRRIADDLSAYYLLGYSSTNTATDGKYRRIEVKVNQPKVSVTARKGYLAPSVDTRAKAVAAAAAAAVPATIAEELARLSRVRADTELLSYGVRSASGLEVVAEISSQEYARGRWDNGADVRAVVARANGPEIAATARIEPGARGAIVHIPLAEGDAAPWRVNLRASTPTAGVDDRLEIPAPAAQGVLGSPIAFRGTASSRIPLRPVADFQFRRNERLRVDWPLLKPVEERTARVLDRRGQPLALNASVTETPAAPGQPATLHVDLMLAPLAEGDYLVELTAGQGAQSERRLLAFRVVR